MDVIFDPNRPGSPGTRRRPAGDADLIKDGDQKSFMQDVVEASRRPPSWWISGRPGAAPARR